MFPLREHDPSLEIPFTALMRLIVCVLLAVASQRKDSAIGHFSVCLMLALKQKKGVSPETDTPLKDPD